MEDMYDCQPTTTTLTNVGRRLVGTRRKPIVLAKGHTQQSATQARRNDWLTLSRALAATVAASPPCQRQPNQRVRALHAGSGQAGTGPARAASPRRPAQHARRQRQGRLLAASTWRTDAHTRKDAQAKGAYTAWSASTLLSTTRQLSSCLPKTRSSTRYHPCRANPLRQMPSTPTCHAAAPRACACACAQCVRLYVLVRACLRALAWACTHTHTRSSEATCSGSFIFDRFCAGVIADVRRSPRSCITHLGCPPPVHAAHAPGGALRAQVAPRRHLCPALRAPGRRRRLRDHVARGKQGPPSRAVGQERARRPELPQLAEDRAGVDASRRPHAPAKNSVSTSLGRTRSPADARQQPVHGAGCQPR